MVGHHGSGLRSDWTMTLSGLLAPLHDDRGGRLPVAGRWAPPPGPGGSTPSVVSMSQTLTLNRSAITAIGGSIEVTSLDGGSDELAVILSAIWVREHSICCERMWRERLRRAREVARQRGVDVDELDEVTR